MTFYNVISGILFIGTCQAFVVHYGTPTAWYASLLMVVMFYESVITSHLLEGQDPPVKTYSLKMKVLDLLAFILLAYALIAVSPDSNPFGGGAAMPGAASPSLFLFLLGAYGIVAICWNAAAGRSFERYSLVPPIVLFGAAGLLRLLFHETAFGKEPTNQPPAWIGIVLTVAMSGYLAFTGSWDRSEEQRRELAERKDEAR